MEAVEREGRLRPDASQRGRSWRQGMLMIDTPQDTLHGPKSGPKKRARSPDRAHQGRDELKTAQDHRGGMPPTADVSHCGQHSDHAGVRALVGVLPPAHHLPADRRYDADRCREVFEDMGMRPRIPSRNDRKTLRTTSRAIASATRSRTASLALRTGDVSRPIATGFQGSSCPHAPWLPWLCSGFES